MKKLYGLNKVSLMWKMSLATIGICLVVWALVDLIQRETFENIFYENVNKDLGLRATEDRLQFDRHLKSFHHLADIIVSQHSFVEYYNKQAGHKSDTSLIIHEDIPQWYIERSSTLRAFPQPNYVFLIDSKGRVREVFADSGDEIPEDLLYPSSLMIQRSFNQSFMTQIGQKPFLITSAPHLSSKGELVATIMIVAEMDEVFITASMGPYVAKRTIALVGGSPLRIIASSNPADLPSGTMIEDISSSFLMTGNAFFDYGSSDLEIGLASFVSADEVNAMTNRILNKVSAQRFFMAFTLITLFLGIMLYMTRRIKQLTANISDFTLQSLGDRGGVMVEGDELKVLEDTYLSLRDGIIKSTNALDDYREHLEELVTDRTQALRESEERYRRIISDSPIGITICDSTGQCIDANDSMASIVGATREQILKQNYHEIPSWKESGLYEKTLSALKEKKTKRVDVSLTTSFGIVIHMNCYLVPLPSGELLFMAQDVTDIMKAEKALKESEERFRSIFEHAQDGILLTNLSEKKFHIGNKSICSMLGYSPEEIKALTISDIHPVEDLPWIMEKFEMMGRGELSAVSDIPVMRRDGSVFYCDINASPITLYGEEYLIGLFHDITMRKRAEDDIRKSAARLAEAQRIAHLGSWDWDLPTNNLYWSDESYRIFGFEQGAIKPTYDVFLKTVHPADVDLVTNSVTKALTERDHYSIEHRIILPDGTERVVHEQAEVLIDESGKPVRMSGTVHDITERKRIEQELDKYREHLEDLVDERTRALKDSEESFRAIADYTYGWESWYNEDGKLLWINPAVERHTGYSVDECLSMPDYPRPLIIEEDRARIQQDMANAVRDRSTNSDVEFSILHKDGSVRRMSAGWQPIYGKDGEYLGIRSSIRDVTESKNAEEEIKEYARIQSVLLKEINHRVKNNLSAIMGMVNAEINDADEKESAVLNKLSSRIMGLSSVHNMLSRSEWNPILLSELCEEVFKGVLAGKPESVTTHYTVSPSWIRVESGQAHQLAMLINELAINSLKHGLGDRDSLSITLDIEKKGEGEVSIVYRDDGPGYPEAIIKGDYSAASIGFDVILSIAQKNLRGDIELTNEGGATCMFNFTLLENK